jgi:hypothetical protein
LGNLTINLPGIQDRRKPQLETQIQHALTRVSRVSGAAIGGIVAGAIALIAAIVAVVLFMRRRKRSAGGVYDLGTPSHMYELNPNSTEPLGGRLDPFYPAQSQFRGSGSIRDDSTLNLNATQPPPSAIPFRREDSEDPFVNPGIGHLDSGPPRGDPFSHDLSEPLSIDSSQTASSSSAPQETAQGRRLIAHNPSASIDTTITAVVSETVRFSCFCTRCLY